jgi:hypothetical protein
MPVQIALQAVPSQQLQVVLGGQNCQIAVYLLGSQLFVDVQLNGTDLSIGVVAHDQIPLIPTVYFGFQGNILFVDTQGSTDPVYTGLGARYQLLYLTAADYAAIVAANAQ